jgi:hypothetical protein
MKIKTLIFLISGILNFTAAFPYDFTIHGLVREKISGKAVENQKIFFHISESAVLTSIQTDKTGFYIQKFSFKEISLNIIEVYTISECSSKPDTIFQKTISFEGKTEIDFDICQAIPCRADFQYTISNRDFQCKNISVGNYKETVWDFGDNGLSTEDSPNHNFEIDGNYKVCLSIENSENCKSKLCSDINVKGYQTVSGTVYLKDNPAETGQVYLMKSNAKKFFTLCGISEIRNGKYDFEKVESGNYYIYAIPNFKYNFHFFPKYLPTYITGNLDWSESNGFNIQKENKSSDIRLMSYDFPFYGTCSIAGNLSFFGNIRGETPESTPIILFNETGIPMDFTMSDSITGDFSFYDLPTGKYRLHPEKVNYQTVDYEVELTNSLQTKTDLKFTVEDSIIQKKEDPPAEIYTYPNPISDVLNVNLNELNAPKGISINAEVFDISGQKIISRTLLNNSENLSINTKNLIPGIYFLQIRNSKKEIIGFRRVVKCLR